MIQEVYILGISQGRDGLVLDYICQTKESLTELARSVFTEDYNHLDDLKIHSIGTNDIGDIEIKYSSNYSDGGIETKRYYYLKKALK